jgi:hypothetical protein
MEGLINSIKPLYFVVASQTATVMIPGKKNQILANYRFIEHLTLREICDIP